ncbi:MAG: LLM class flavin-dependent oxidoreductase, partial [Gemmatimonadota bacterium]
MSPAAASSSGWAPAGSSGSTAPFGFAFPADAERVGMLAEQVEIVHRLWDRDEDPVTFEGAHYRLDEVTSLPRPLQE